MRAADGDVQRVIGGVDRQHGAQVGPGSVELSEALEAGVDLGDDLGGAVRFRDAEDLAHLLDDRQQRDGLSERQTAALEPGRLLAGERQPAFELVDQARLADPGLAADERHLSTPPLGLVEQIGKGVQLALATDVWRQAVLGAVRWAARLAPLAVFWGGEEFPPQKCAPGRPKVPQRAQRTVRGAPQVSQKWYSAGFSAAQAAHCMSAS